MGWRFDFKLKHCSNIFALSRWLSIEAYGPYKSVDNTILHMYITYIENKKYKIILQIRACWVRSVFSCREHNCTCPIDSGRPVRPSNSSMVTVHSKVPTEKMISKRTRNVKASRALHVIRSARP